MNKTLTIALIITVVLSVGLSLLLGGTTTIKEVTNNLGAIADPFNMGSETGQNGLQVAVVSGSFKNATTSFVVFNNPFPATATLDFLTLRNTGVSTTTYSFRCGPMTSSTTNAFSKDFMAVGTIATSTNFGTVVNNTATSTGNVLFGSITGESGYGTRIQVSGSGNTDTLGKVKCIAEIESGYTDVTFSKTSTGFSGDWKARFIYQRKQ